MIRYNDYDLQIMENLGEVFSYLKIDIPDDEEVWHIAREDGEVPCFENILIDLTLSRVTAALEDKFPELGLDISCYVDCRASYLSVNGEEINSLSGLRKVLDEARQELQECSKPR